MTDTGSCAGPDTLRTDRYLNQILAKYMTVETHRGSSVGGDFPSLVSEMLFEGVSPRRNVKERGAQTTIT